MRLIIRTAYAARDTARKLMEGRVGDDKNLPAYRWAPGELILRPSAGFGNDLI